MNELIIMVFLAVIPGFISMTIILDNIITKKFKPFNFVLYSTIIGLISYILLDVFNNIFISLSNCIFHADFVYRKLSIWTLTSVDPKNWTINLTEVFFASIVSLILAIIIIIFINNKLLNKLFRHFNITYKFGDESLFYYYLNSSDMNWIYVRDHDNDIIYEGSIKSYSEDGKYQEIVLLDVSIYNNKRKPDLLYSVPSLYICREFGKITIEEIPEKYIKKE